MLYIDTHAHYDLKNFNKDRATLLDKVQDNGIGIIVNAAIGYESNFQMIEKLSDKTNVYFALGIHPNRVGTLIEVDEAWENGLAELLSKRDERIVAIGETGLDFYRLSRENDGKLDEESQIKVERQYKWFRRHIQWSMDEKIPLILHVRDAHREALSVLDEYKEGFSDRTGVVHCFNGDSEVAKKYIELGFYVGIGGMVTDLNNEKLRDAVRTIPLSRILLETDSPYVTPVGATEKRNTSLNIPIIAKEVAKIKQISLEEIAKVTTDNAMRLFNIGIDTEN